MFRKNRLEKPIRKVARTEIEPRFGTGREVSQSEDNWETASRAWCDRW